MLKVMRIYCVALDVEVDVSNAKHHYKNFEALERETVKIIEDTFFDWQNEIGIKRFIVHPFNKVQYLSHEEQVITEQDECQIEVLIHFYGKYVEDEFMLEVAASEQADIDEAQKYMQFISRGQGVSLTKIIRIPKEFEAPSFVS